MLSRFKAIYDFIRFSHRMRKMFLLFLLPAFFLLHGYNETIGIIPFSDIISLFLWYLLVTFLIICLNLFIFRLNHKAFIFSFYLLSLFFFFGAMHDMMKQVLPPPASSYFVVIPLLFFTSIGLFWWLKRSKQFFLKLQKFIVALLLVFLGMEILVTVYYLQTHKSRENDLAGTPPLIAGDDREVSGKKGPDIYFIVMDGYASSANLKEVFDYSNAELDSVLTGHNFFISRLSGSNYNLTPFSLTSTLDLDYLKPGIENRKLTSKRFMQGVNMLQTNKLINFLQLRGYDLKNYGCFEMSGMPLQTIPYFRHLYPYLIDNQTLYARVKRDIAWFFSTKDIFRGKFKIPKEYKEIKKYHLYRNNYNYEHLLNELVKDSESPKFVYTHLMLPHEPFYLKEDGTEVSDQDIILRKLDLKSGYIDQVKYANRLLKKIIALANRPSKREKIIIIEGDHGYRFYTEKKDLSKEFPNLNAYYFSDHDYSDLYDGISPVNTFRVVLNKYFSANYSLLKDSSVYLAQ